MGLNRSTPLEGGGAESEVRYEGQTPPSSLKQEGTTCLFQAVTPDYFRAMGIAVIRGRAFTERDGAERVPVALVEEALVHKFFANVGPIGRRIAFGFTGHGPAASRSGAT